MDKQSLFFAKAQNKCWQPDKFEPEISKFWEKGKFFTAKIDKKKKPFSILLPLPNANDSMHIGHVMFVIEDILCRWHRMMGDPTLWLPGADHAGIETQFVFEKKLAKEGKSRFDFDRETLYGMIRDFVEENRQLNQFQLNRLGFGFDWSRYHYSMEPAMIKKVLAMFNKLHQDGFIYRGSRIVNYCVNCGTAFSELEVDYAEKDEFLYYLDYGPVKIATTRPETIFADVAVAVNPKDKRLRGLVGKSAVIPLLDKQIPIISDELVSFDFGTGALKITPAHDPTDFEIGRRHELASPSCLDLNGRMINCPKELLGLTANQAKQKTIEMLEKAGKLVKTEPHKHNVGFCYRCKRRIEPLLTPQWFIKMEPLAKGAIKAAKSGETKFFPARFKKTFLDWVENIRDWNISRQIVWGPRIPAWYCLDCNPEIKINFLDKNKKLISGFYKDLKKDYSFDQIVAGLQSISAPTETPYSLKEGACAKCKGKHTIQETDTFDTWFLSGQWPLNTLGFDINDPKKGSEDFNYFYPTTIMDTLWDILFFWVAKMMILGIYATGKSPFETVHLHARVVDGQGKKMSKSKGNVANPIELVDKYGADALRMALVYGVAPASDIALSDEKVRAMRNFTNKIWNAARFVLANLETTNSNPPAGGPNKDDQEILEAFAKIKTSVDKQLKKYRFGQALEEIYQFFWHQYCDQYIEKTKDRRQEALPTLIEVLTGSLKLLHPFAPFVTEAVYQEFKKILPENKLFEAKSLTVASWD
ncbi:MAG: valine--tRNA ligase [Patescibacteria group bacterium]